MLVIRTVERWCVGLPAQSRSMRRRKRAAKGSSIAGANVPAGFDRFLDSLRRKSQSNRMGHAQSCGTRQVRPASCGSGEGREGNICSSSATCTAYSLKPAASTFQVFAAPRLDPSTIMATITDPTRLERQARGIAPDWTADAQ